MTKLLPLCMGIAFGLALGGCRPVKPEMSVEGIPQACCTSADPQLTSFKGCRVPQRSCKSRQGEKFWMRGDVACSPVDDGQCDGGRCCHYRPQYDPNLSEPIENWAPPGHDKPTNNVTDPNAAPQHDAPEPGAKTKTNEPAAEATADEAAPEPADEADAPPGGATLGPEGSNAGSAGS